MKPEFEKAHDDERLAAMSEPDTETYFRFFNEIGIINQLVSNRVERMLPHGLTMSQFTVLNHFSRGLPSKSPLGLANAFQVTKGAMTNTLKQLDGKGFIAIEPHESDGRSKIVSITDRGRVAHRDALAEIAKAMSAFVEIVGRDEIDNAIPMLQKVRIWLDENRT